MWENYDSALYSLSPFVNRTENGLTSNVFYKVVFLFIRAQAFSLTSAWRF